MSEERLRAILDNLPAKPGVYLMKDAANTVIYVGKAINLRNRVRSYFHKSADHSAKVRRLVEQIADIEFIVTDTELEALILENTLIKEYRPKYNVQLKDDKNYAYIKVTVNEDFPRVLKVRQMLDDGARYYGPFSSARAVRTSLDLLRKMFAYRTCERVITGKDTRPCLFYHIKRCMGPCIGAANKDEYRAMIDRLDDFLAGRRDEIVEKMRREMHHAAEKLYFERAALLRDQLFALQKVTEQQKVISSACTNQDVIGFARDDGQACVQVFFVRGGKLIGRESFFMEGTDEENDRDIMAAFVKQFYNTASYIPSEIILPNEIDELMIIERWLRRKQGNGGAILRIPHEGSERELVNMVISNALETLNSVRAIQTVDAETTPRIMPKEDSTQTALAKLQEALDLPALLHRIECYDISNIHGTNATGSMAVFVDGQPSKENYRRFRIKTVIGSNDVAMMKEVLTRRFKRAMAQDEKWADLPDLLIVDGGKPQLGGAVEVLDKFGLREQVPVTGLAKRLEELFVPDRATPILLPRGSPELFLVQRIRDEAHRFAVTYHRKLRSKSGITSVLEEIPGIGPKRRKSLLTHFGSLDKIRKATVEELAAIESMNRAAAQRVKEYL